MKRTLIEQTGDFLLGKGFYIVLFLCVATIGISAYYLVDSFTPETSSSLSTPATATPEVTLPDPVQEKAQTPLPSLTTEEDDTEEQAEEPVSNATLVEDSSQDVAVTQEETTSIASSTVFTWPVKGTILREHSVDALSLDVTMQDWRTHSGLDIAASVGDSVLSPSRGQIVSVSSDDMLGTTVVIDHGNGIVSTLANLSAQTVVKVGDSVEPGTVVGSVGTTALGESGMDPHLHLEMTVDGVAVDPTTLLP